MRLIFLDPLRFDANGNCTNVTAHEQPIQLYYDYLIKLGSVCGGFITLTCVGLLLCYVYNKRKNKNGDIRGSDVTDTVMMNPYYDLAFDPNQAPSEHDEIWALN